MSSTEETRSTIVEPARGAAAGERPTRVRYGVLGFAASLSMITYLDRACMGSAAEGFVHDLGLTSVADLYLVFTAFTLAYALFEIPTGWLGDVFGPRKVLIRIVLCWSAFTALTGLIGLTVGNHLLGAITVGQLMITPLAVLVAVRFLFGIGEAGAYPNITRALHNWFPFQQRGLAQGVVWMSGRLMGGLTPFVWLLLVEGISRTSVEPSGQQTVVQVLSPLMHWRTTFWVFAIVGVVWCVLFAVWFRNRPEEKHSVNDGELLLIRSGKTESRAAHAGVPWRRIFSSGNLWILCLMYACQSYGWYFYMTYLPNFLKNHYGVMSGDMLGAIYKGGPLWLGALGCLTGGFLTDWFIRRTGNRRWGRRLFGMTGHALTAVCFSLCLAAPSAFWFFLAVSLAGFFTDLAMGPAWATCQDIGRRYAAIVAGCMNMIGNLGGTMASLVTGYIVQQSLADHGTRLGVSVEQMTDAQKIVGELPGYHLSFLLFSGVFVIGTVCWSRIDATKPVVPEAQ